MSDTQDSPLHAVKFSSSSTLRSMVQEDLTHHRFNDLRHCVSAGEPLNEEVVLSWEAATGLVIKEGYGQTESTLLAASFPGMLA